MPTPTAILELSGSRHAKRRAAERRKRGEPGLMQPVAVAGKVATKPRRSKPKRPARVSGERRKVWLAAEKLAADLGVLHAADAITLEMFADLVVRYRAVMAQLDRAGEVFVLETKTGQRIMQQTPQVAIVGQLIKLLGIMGDRLGFSPAARARLSAGASGEAIDPDQREILDLVAESRKRHRSA